LWITVHFFDKEAVLQTLQSQMVTYFSRSLLPSLLWCSGGACMVRWSWELCWW